jgi:hypothetical protein
MLTMTNEPGEPAATETTAEPFDPLKLESPKYTAVTVVLPTGRLGPVAVKVAIAAPPTFTTGATPSVVRPVLNTTEPVGTVELAAAGVTVAVNCTEPPRVIAEGLAASEVEVPTSAGVGSLHWVTRL